MSYIFTICNSLQGLYIFCVHCLLNHQVREEYRRGFRRFQSKKSDSEATSGSTMPMTIKSQSQASEVSNLEVKSARVVENHLKNASRLLNVYGHIGLPVLESSDVGTAADVSIGCWVLPPSLP
ncbi:hypothetical protein AB205_0196110, partial [Aquarana catesbeiana]